MQSVRVTPVVGLPQFTGWSQVVDTVFAAGNHVVAAIAIQGDNAGSVGREIVSLLLEQEPHSAKKLYQMLEYFLNYADEQQCRLSITAGLFVEGGCILASSNGSVILRRNGKIGTIVQAKGDIALLEGTLRADDVFIFTTLQAQQFTSTIEQQFEKGFDVDGVITGIVPAVHSLSDSSLSALAFVTTQVLEEKSFVTTEIDSYTAEQVEDVTEAISEPETAEPEPPEAEVQQRSPQKISGPSLAVKLRETFSAVPKLFSKKTYVGTFLPKKTLYWLIGVAILIGVSAVLLFFFVLRARAQEQQAVTLITPYKERLAAARALTETDLIEGREAVRLVVEDLTKLQSEQGESSKQIVAAVDATLQEARDTYTAVSGKEELSELPIFYDLRLASPEFVTSLVTIQGTKGVFLDDHKKQLVVLDLEAKNVFVKSLEQLQSVRSLSPQEDENVVLLTDGIYSVALTTESQPVEIKESGDSNSAATFVNTFGAYVYVLNPEKRNIYRYVKSDGAYSDPIGWLQGPLGVQFNSVSSMSIDGDLWITTTEGAIKKFTSGREAAFTIVGLQEAFDTPIWLYTRENTTNLYILEPAKRRLVILTKTGEFVREVKSNSLASATGVFVNDALQKAFAVSGSIVYEIAL